MTETERLKIAVGLLNSRQLTEYAEACERLENQYRNPPTKSCDGCGRELSLDSYGNGRGLCFVCIDVIN